MSLHSRANVICFYCNKTYRRDKLELHTSNKHPGCIKKERPEKGTQNISSLFKRVRTEAHSDEAISDPLSREVQHTGDTTEESPSENITLQKVDHGAMGKGETNSGESTAGLDDITDYDMDDTESQKPPLVDEMDDDIDDTESQTTPLVDETSSNPYPNDPGLYVNSSMNPEFVRRMLALGPCQPGLNSPYEFPKSNGRSFRKQWYTPQMKNGMTRYRDWLVYSPKKIAHFVLHAGYLLRGMIPIMTLHSQNQRMGFIPGKKPLKA